MAEREYRHDMSHTTWDKVFARQQARQEAAMIWLDHLQISPGETLVDIGSGPGLLSLLAAERVGPAGKVIAVDRSPEALAYLGALQAERGVANILRIVQDAAVLQVPDENVSAALLTVTLHHNDNPSGLVTAAYNMLRPGGRCLVAEYHPEAAGNVGPPLRVRLHPDQVRRLLAAVGFRIADSWTQGDELYGFLAVKP